MWWCERAAAFLAEQHDLPPACALACSAGHPSDFHRLSLHLEPCDDGDARYTASDPLRGKRRSVLRVTTRW